jgi:hypothetical protein
MMAVAAPDWLTKHGGDLGVSKDNRRYVVYFAKEPQYVVEVIPTRSKFGTHVAQTINGRRLDNTGVFSSPDEAAAAGLEDLRKSLGW